MSDIPEDIMEKARECARLSWRPNLTLSEAFAEAILAERQRCAEVARGFANLMADCNLTVEAECGTIIADAIMNPEPTDEPA